MTLNPFRLRILTNKTFYRRFSMSNSEESVKQLITKQLSPHFLSVKDLSDGCGAKFDVIVVSDKFDNKPLLQRHRMVNEALGETMKSIHAVTMKTYTPSQWKSLGEVQSS